MMDGITPVSKTVTLEGHLVDGYSLREQIEVVVEEFEDGSFFVEWALGNVRGYGQSEEIALINLKVNMLDVIEDLNEEPDRLSDNLKRQRAALNRAMVAPPWAVEAIQGAR